MSTFILNPNFKNELAAKVLKKWADEISEANDRVISIPRLWEGWETSDPFRDIIDTEKLRLSRECIKTGKLRYTLRWATPYIYYVYLGYTLENGKRIPPRKWVEIAYRENNYKKSLQDLLKK